MNENDSITGTDRIPDRYAGADGRETIDTIRDAMTDTEFVAFCYGNMIAYRARAGKKRYPDMSWDESTRADEAKASFYEDMAKHVLGRGPDPRQYPGAVPYQRQPFPGKHGVPAFKV